MRSKLTVLLIFLVLNACSIQREITVFNNTGEPVSIQVGKKTMVIAIGENTQFNYPGDDEGWMVYLLSGKCKYTYQLPKRLDHYPRSPEYTGPVKVQIEQGDFDIYILPTDVTGPAPVKNISTFQKDGFPLHPIAKICD